VPNASRMAIVGLAIAAGLVGIPTTVHADPPAPSDWRSEIESVTPDSDAIVVTTEGGDSFVRVSVDPGHDVVVLGYEGEPYLWIDGEGDVFENQQSPATYYNRSRDGSGEVPDDVDPAAAPEWKKVGDGGAWAWHDHRAHWMGGDPPIGMEPGDALPDSIVPLTVDGVPTDVTVSTVLVAPPSIVPALIGAVLAIALVIVCWRGWQPLAIAVLALALPALAIGLTQYVSLPAETGPRLFWWVAPMVALACGAALLLIRHLTPFVRAGLLLIAAGQLAIWGWQRRFGIVRPVLPTPAPGWLDRGITAAALAGGLSLVVAAIVDLTDDVRQESVARSIAASS
jgi:hypothetical protein